MAKHFTELENALLCHRAKLNTVEAISKVCTPSMQQILSSDLEAFGKRLDSWATAAPLASIIDIYDRRQKQP